MFKLVWSNRAANKLYVEKLDNMPDFVDIHGVALLMGFNRRVYDSYVAWIIDEYLPTLVK